MIDSAKRPFAVVTGASTGIGYELARQCAENGFDLLIAADELRIYEAAKDFRAMGVSVEAIEVDLATPQGIERLCKVVGERPVDALLANAGRGLGRAFLDQDLDQIRRVIDTNISGTVDLLQKIGRKMQARREGRILITGSVAGLVPGTYSAVYNATKAFLDLFASALRAELKESGVTVTCLMPGITDTAFFERADMLDTRLYRSKKDSPADVAKAGFEGMMHGEAEVVRGWKNRLATAIAPITPTAVLAEQHRKLAEPGYVAH